MGNELSTQAQAVLNSFNIFEDMKPDVEVVINNYGDLIRFIEDIETFAVLCRKKMVHYKDLYISTSSLDNKNNTDVNVKKDSKSVLLALRKLDKNVKLEYENGILKLTTIPLISNMTLKTKRYIYEIISNELKQFKKANNEISYHSTPSVVAIVTKAPSKAVLNDSDNIEISGIINALKVFYLYDDNPEWLSVYRAGEVSEVPMTEVYLMPEALFPNWLSEKNNR